MVMSSKERIDSNNVNINSNSMSSSVECDSPAILPDVTYVPDSHSYHSNPDRESQPLLRRMDSADGDPVINNVFIDDPEFTALIREAEQAIENGVPPKIISQGTSGSYFIMNEAKVRFIYRLIKISIY
jgi:phosphatidylinositol 4-kinase type 2